MAKTNVQITISAKDKASGVMGKIGKSFGTAAKGVAVGLGAVGVGLGAFGASAIAAGSDVEEMLGKFNVVFDNLAGETTKKLTEFADKVGRNKNELMGFAAGLQDTFVPLGFARDAAADMSVAATKLAVDLASFNNVAEEDVVRDLQSALVGNTETLRKYGVVANEATIRQEAINLGLVKGKEAISAQDKAAAIFNLTLKGTEDALDDAENTSESWANQMRGLKSKIQETVAEIGLKLIPVVKPLLTKLAELAKDIGPKVIDFFGKLAGAIQILATGEFDGDLLRQMGVFEDSPIIGKIFNIRDAIMGVVAFIKKNITIISNFFQSEKGEALIQFVKDLVASIGAFISGVGAGFKEYWPLVTDIFKNQLMPAVKELIDTIKELFGSVVGEGEISIDTFKEIGETVGSVMAGAVTAIVGVITFIVKLITFAVKVRLAFVNAFKAVVNWVMTARKNILNFATKVITTFLTIRGAIRDAFTGGVGIVKNMINGILKVINNGISNINTLISNLRSTPVVGELIPNISIPKVPLLAEGGIVTKPTLAVIGEAGPEAVVPLDKAGGGLGGVNVNVNIPLFMGDEASKRRVGEEIWIQIERIARSRGVDLPSLNM